MNHIPIYELETAAKTLAFFSARERPLTPEELWKTMSKDKRPENMESLLDIVEILEKNGFIKNENGLLAVAHINKNNIIKNHLQLKAIQKSKWSELLKYRKYFNLIPFVDFALVSGSLSIGVANKNSDFDITIGSKRGRIFTVRLITAVVFGILGVRRKDGDSKKDSSGKFCFNHFVAPSGYKLMTPHTFSFEKMYQSFVPIYGREEAVIKFSKANDWAKRDAIVFDNKWHKKTFNPFRKTLELILSGTIGNLFEKIVKHFQLKRINSKREFNKDVRIYCSDEELEFHPKEPVFSNLAESYLNLFKITDFQ